MVTVVTVVTALVLSVRLPSDGYCRFAAVVQIEIPTTHLLHFLSMHCAHIWHHFKCTCRSCMVHETFEAALRRQRSDLSAASNRLIRAVRMRAQYAAENEENGYCLGYCASNHSGNH